MDDRKQMFQATCDKCGDKCEVPFKPTSGKPVLCSNCFGQQGNRHQDRRGGGDRGRRSFDRGGRSGGDREMHQATCDKCGNKCEVPFRPTAGKPIYCNDCFGSKSGGGDRRGDRRGGGGGDRRGGNDQVAQQLNGLNSKLDKVIGLLEAAADINKPPKKIITVKAATKKSAAKKPAAKKPAAKKAATKKPAKKKAAKKK